MPIVALNKPVPEYGKVPPVAVTVTVVEEVLQDTRSADENAVKVVGSVIVPAMFDEQPFASLTV